MQETSQIHKTALRAKLRKQLTFAQMKDLRKSVIAETGKSTRAYDHFLTNGTNSLAIAASLCKHLDCTLDQLFDQDHKFTGLVTSTVTPNPETV